MSKDKTNYQKIANSCGLSKTYTEFRMNTEQARATFFFSFFLFKLILLFRLQWLVLIVPTVPIIVGINSYTLTNYSFVWRIQIFSESHNYYIYLYINFLNFFYHDKRKIWGSSYYFGSLRICIVQIMAIECVSLWFILLKHNSLYLYMFVFNAIFSCIMVII